MHSITISSHSLPGITHHSHLQTQTNTQVGLLLHTGKGSSLNHTFYTTITKTARHENTVCLIQTIPSSLVLGRIALLGGILEIGSLHPVNDGVLVNSVSSVLHRLQYVRDNDDNDDNDDDDDERWIWKEQRENKNVNQFNRNLPWTR